MTLKVTQGNSTSRISPPISGHCSDNVSILHRFRDTTTLTVYVADCDLRRPSRSMSSSCSYRPCTLSDSSVNTWYIFLDTRCRKVSNNWSKLQCHSRSLTLVRFDRPDMISYQSCIVTMSASCIVSEILSLIYQNLNRLCNPEIWKFKKLNLKISVSSIGYKRPLVTDSVAGGVTYGACRSTDPKKWKSENLVVIIKCIHSVYARTH